MPLVYAARAHHVPAAGFPLPASSASSSASRLVRAFSTIRHEMIEASYKMIKGIARLVWLMISGGVPAAVGTTMRIVFDGKG